MIATSKPPTDESLMATLAAGRIEALETIYDRYGGLSYSVALRLTGDRGAAEEVVQDAFVSVWQKASTYDPRYGKVRSWLLQIVRNRAIDELRRQRSPIRNRNLHQPLDGTDGPHPGASMTEEDATLVTELRSVVQGALKILPKDQLKMVEMAYFEGLSQREISERTGIPLGTVKTRSRLALIRLRKVFGSRRGDLAVQQ
jgi:RNA polymerase sigma-70 factor (ECF subfamily)